MMVFCYFLDVLTTLGNVLPKIEKPAVEDMIMTTMVPETTTAEQYMTTAVMEGTAGSQGESERNNMCVLYRHLDIKPYNAYKGFFLFEIIIYVFVSSFCFISIPMLWVYGH